MSIEVMKQALEALENVRGYDVENLYGFDDEITALRQAIAEAEKQEPVAWMSVDCVGDRYLYFSKPLDNDPVTPLYSALPHDFDNVTDDALIEEVRRRGFTIRDAQISPKRWVGLTDEERHEIREWQEIQKKLGPVWAPMMLYLYIAIEAKLKERNT